MKNKLDNVNRDANIIKWIALISVINAVLYFIAILYFLVYTFKLSKLKNDQSLSGVFNRLKGKKSKELKSIKEHNEPVEQQVAGLLIAHKSMVTMLVVMGIITIIILGVIFIFFLSGIEMV